jgi:hypothetical protein
MALEDGRLEDVTCTPSVPLYKHSKDSNSTNNIGRK